MREIRPSGSVEGVMGNHDPYSDLGCSVPRRDFLPFDSTISPPKSDDLSCVLCVGLGHSSHPMGDPVGLARSAPAPNL